MLLCIAFRGRSGNPFLDFTFRNRQISRELVDWFDWLIHSSHCPFLSLFLAFNREFRPTAKSRNAVYLAMFDRVRDKSRRTVNRLTKAEIPRQARIIRKPMMVRRIARTAVIELSRTEKQTVWNDAEQEAAVRPGRHAVTPPSYGTLTR